MEGMLIDFSKQLLKTYYVPSHKLGSGWNVLREKDIYCSCAL